MRRLLAAGASATVKTPDGETPLHVAGISGNADVAKALIQSGAELNSRVTSKRGLQMTPLT